MNVFSRYLLIFSLFIFFSFIEASTDIAEIFEITNEGNDPNSPEILGKIIEAQLQSYMLKEEGIESETSLFAVLVPIFASLTSSSQSKQYKLYTDTLFDHMEKISLSAILNSKRGLLTENDKKSALKKIYLTADETKFLLTCKLPTYIPDKTVMLMLKAVISLDPESSKTHEVVIKLGQYCESDSCQELFYSFILSSITGPNRKSLPQIKVIPYIKSVEKYNEFIFKCFDIQQNVDTSDRISTDVFINNLIYGPCTRGAAYILFKILDVEHFQMISSDNNLIIRTSRFIFTSGTFDMFDQLLTPEVCSNNVEINEMKSNFIKWKLIYDKIIKVISDETVKHFDKQIFTEFVDIYKEDQNIFDEYFKFDPDFVVESVVKLDAKIFKLVDKFKQSENVHERILILSINFVLLNLIPLKLYPDLLGRDYTPLLDGYVDREIVKTNPFFSNAMLVRIIYLPHSKITATTVLKLYQAVSLNEKDPAAIFSPWIVLALLKRDFDDEIFMTAFESCHEAFEKLKLDFSLLSTYLTQILLRKNDHDLSKTLLNYCKDHKLLPKSKIILAEKHISNLFHKSDIRNLPSK